MVAEARLGRAPVRDGVAVRLVGRLELRLVPVHVDRRIALDVERFLVGLAEPRVEHELRRAARVAHALRLRERHVIGHAVLRLTGREALQERRAAVLDAVEDRAIQLRRIRDRDLRHERRAVTGEERFRDGLLLDVLALRRGAEHVHVVAAEHRRRVGVLPAGVRVDLRVEHHAPSRSAGSAGSPSTCSGSRCRPCRRRRRRPRPSASPGFPGRSSPRR